MPLPRSIASQLTPEEVAIWNDIIDLTLLRREAYQGKEHVFQTSLINCLKLLHGRWPELQRLHAIPNGGGRSKAEAGRLKAEGVKKGVSDLSLPVARGRHHGLYMELKTAGVPPTYDQVKWLIGSHREGYRAVIVNDMHTALGVINAYLLKKQFTGN